MHAGVRPDERAPGCSCSRRPDRYAHSAAFVWTGAALTHAFSVSSCRHLAKVRCSDIPAGLTVAEYFRDQEGQDVLLFIDNIFRFTQANSEVPHPSS